MKSKAKPRCAKHCSSPRLICPTTSRGWRSRELRLDDLNSPLPQSLCKFLRRARIRNQPANSCVRTYPRNATAPQLAEIRHHVHFLRRPDHYIVELRLEHVRRRGTVLQVETIHR